MSPNAVSNGSSTPTTAPPFRAAICGGGIGGLSLAIGLLHHNVPFHLFEAAPAFAEIGAGVSFGPNAVRALGLIDPRIRSLYEKIETRNPDPASRTKWFDFQLGMDSRCSHYKAGDRITSLHALNVGQSSVHRAHFLDGLVSLVPKENYTFGKKVVNLTTLPNDGGIRLHFADSTTASASIVIGCDGIKSNIRPILLGTDHPAAYAVFTSKYAYRGLIPMDLAVAALGEQKARNSQMYLGYDGHVLTFPIEKGETMNVVAFYTQHDGIWPEKEWVVPMDRKKMESDFQDWGPDVQNILKLMQKPDLWGLFNHLPAPCYVGLGGRVAVMGDAAHASTPHQGAGAGMALEDSFILSNLLGRLVHTAGQPTTGQISATLHAYDVVRRPRTQKVVRTSRQGGELYDFHGYSSPPDEAGTDEAPGKYLGDDVEAIAGELQRRFDWLWTMILEGPEGLEKAVGIMDRLMAEDEAGQEKL